MKKSLKDKIDQKTKNVSAPATIPPNGLRTMSDGSVRLVIDMQELDSNTMSKLFDLRDEYGIFVFAPEGTKEVDIPEIKPEFKTDKTPSQRLRAVIYRFWEKKKKKDGTGMEFELYYKTKMENLINQFKEKLDG